MTRKGTNMQLTVYYDEMCVLCAVCQRNPSLSETNW